ncbi:hypothetical protein ARMSODRAFT_175827 [Armillaria solidipes]|uniref:Uncharacterized protein n=1 Tax=Armillaria solidipes TaxID=1076256 RepID=A0A2H3BE07_9AGAR|nr:hypothetical protein ARMSODRAFT_175827 [Armillaria solidipes]
MILIKNILNDVNQGLLKFQTKEMQKMVGKGSYQKVYHGFCALELNDGRHRIWHHREQLASENGRADCSLYKHRKPCASREASGKYMYRHNTDKAVISGHLIFNCRGISSQVLASLGPGESILHAHGFCFAVGRKYHLNVMFPLRQLPSGCRSSVLNDETESVKRGFSCHAILHA